jgi:hypothetical protein
MSCHFVPPGIRFNDCLFTEPVQLTAWRPPGFAGILAIVTRNPQWAPKPLQPLYFAEFGNDATCTVSLPANLRRENLLIAVFPMPYSTAVQRRTLCHELIAGYNPACQINGSLTVAADLAHKVDALEARQQEQNQQILSLLAYIGKLFEPLPVGPRRPIGFLAQLATADATEGGS